MNTTVVKAINCYRNIHTDFYPRCLTFLIKLYLKYYNAKQEFNKQTMKAFLKQIKQQTLFGQQMLRRIKSLLLSIRFVISNSGHFSHGTGRNTFVRWTKVKKKDIPEGISTRQKITNCAICKDCVSDIFWTSLLRKHGAKIVVQLSRLSRNALPC